MTSCACRPDCPREFVVYGGRRRIHPLCQQERANARRLETPQGPRPALVRCTTCDRFTRVDTGLAQCGRCRGLALRTSVLHPRGPRRDATGARYEPVPGDLPAAEIEAIIAAELARIRHGRQVGE